MDIRRINEFDDVTGEFIILGQTLVTLVMRYSLVYESVTHCYIMFEGKKDQIVNLAKRFLEEN